MKLIEGIRRFFRLPPSQLTVDRDLEEELGFHLDMRVEELMRSGMSRDAARVEAVRRFGDLVEARDELRGIDLRRSRRTRRTELRDWLMRDVRHAFRSIRRSPGFALAVVLTLGLGIGANAAMFGLIDQLLLRAPPHVRDPERLRWINITQTIGALGVQTQRATTYPDYVNVRDHARTLEDAAAAFTASASVGRGMNATPVQRTLATGNFFQMLGVTPALGRFFVPEDDAPPDGQRVAVISHGFWRRNFGGRADALGETLYVSGEPFTVVGVAPPRFSGLELEPVDLWLPMSAAGGPFGADWRETRSMSWLSILVRRRVDASAERVADELTTLYVAANPERLGDDAAARVELGGVIAAQSNFRVYGESARVSLSLGGVSLLVLLIACANVGNLLLARAMRRRREVGIRLALGVSRTRLISQIAGEALLLALLGGVFGLGLAHLGGSAIRKLLLPDFACGSSPVDLRVVVCALGLAIVAAAVTALPPAFQAVRSDVLSTLRSGAREGTYHRSRVRTALVLLQATLSVVLLAGAGLFVRSLRNVQTLDMGFDAERVLMLEWDFSNVNYTREQRDALHRDALARLRAMPSIERAAIGITVPFWSAIIPDLHVPGRDSLPTSTDGGPYLNAVSSDFFATVGTRIVRGRAFNEADREGAPRVAIVSESMGRMIWPSEDALGKCIRVGADTVPCSQIVGIAEDARGPSLDDVPVLQYYVPLDQRQVAVGLRVLMIRPRGDALAAVDMVRHELRSLRSDLPYANIRTLASLVDPHVRPWRLGAALFTAFGALALGLAALGLYAVIAYAVAQRTQEVGVRVALGARWGDVAGLVLSQSLRIVLAGIVLGLAIALAAGNAVQPLLFRQSARDPVVMGGVALVLLVIGLAAGFVPLLRALRIDPVVALKHE